DPGAAPAGPLRVVDPGTWRYDTAKGAWRPAAEVPAERAADEPAPAEVDGMLARGRSLPAWFTPARVAAELARLRPARTSRGLTLFFTGLSGSAKSTVARGVAEDRKSTRLNSSHVKISYAVFCLKKKTKKTEADA